MASFFEKLIGGQEEESPKARKPAGKVVTKTVAKKPVAKVSVESKVVPEEKPVAPEPEPEESEPEPETELKSVIKTKEPEKKAWVKTGSGEGQLAIDVFQSPSHVVLQATIGGVKPEDLEVTIENNMVTIHGQRNHTETSESKDYILQECHWGGFSRQFVLPSEVDPTRSEASLKDGVLTIKIPRIQKEKVTKLLIKE